MINVSVQVMFFIWLRQLIHSSLFHSGPYPYANRHNSFKLEILGMYLFCPFFYIFCFVNHPSFQICIHMFENTDPKFFIYFKLRLTLFIPSNSINPSYTHLIQTVRTPPIFPWKIFLYFLVHHNAKPFSILFIQHILLMPCWLCRRCN